ncbi:YadA-like family protein [Streptobacillus felis]|uniref:YadA-like family protein n=1 Tax=Streptobacillus felis TaxID=1384509 RepID=UPI0039E762DA
MKINELKRWLKRKVSIDSKTIIVFLITGLLALGGTISYSAFEGGTQKEYNTDPANKPTETILIDAGYNIPTGKTKLNKSLIIGGYYESAGSTTARQYNTIIGNTAKVYDVSHSLSLGGDIYGKPGENYQRSNIAIGNFTTVGDGVKSINQSIAIGAGDNPRPRNLLNESWEAVKKKNIYGAWAKGDQSIALGGNTVAYGDTSIAIGGDDINKAIEKTVTYTDVDGNVVEGATLKDAFKNFTGIELTPGYKFTGYTPTTANTMAISIGTQAQAEDLGIAIGLRARAEKINTMAIGSGATANLDNSVAIGPGSSTDRPGTKQETYEYNGVTYNWAGGEKIVSGDIVSFGKIGYERQLKNVAAGEVSETSTDAINGSQLNEVIKKLSNTTLTYFHTNNNDPNQAVGNPVTNNGTIDSKAGALGNNSITAGYYANTSEDALRAIAIGEKSFSGGIASVSLGANARSEGLSSIALGATANSTGDESTALGSGANSIGNNSTALGNSSVATIDSSVSLGSYSSTDAAVATNEAIVGPLTYNGFAGNNPHSIVSIGNKNEGITRQLQNVAAGQISKTSTDAINGSQLYATNNALGNLTTATKTILGGNATITPSGDNAGEITMTNIGDTGKDNIHDAIKATKFEITANEGEEANSTTGNVTLTSKEGKDGNTIYDIKLADKVTLGSGDKAVTVDGTTGTIGGLSNKTFNPTNITSGQAATEDQLKSLHDSINTNISNYGFNVTSGKEGSGTTSGTVSVSKVSKDETVTLKAGDNLDIKQDGKNFTYSLSKDITGINSIELKGETGKDGVTIKGPDGQDGLDGKLGISGKDGKDAVSLSGKDGVGTIGLKGADGKSADIQVSNGKDGLDGLNPNGKTRIVYEPKDSEGNPILDKDGAPVKEEVATLNDGLKFAGDNGDSEDNIIKKALNEKLEIVGGADKDKLSDNNIGVNAKDGKLEVKLSKELKDLTSAEFKDADGNTTVINPTGITLTPSEAGKNPVTLSNTGLDNGGNQITNVASGGNVETNAANIGDVKKLSTKITANEGEEANSTTGNVTLTSKEGKDGNTIYDIKLADKVTLGSGDKAVTVDGTTGTIGGLSNKTFNPTNITSGQAATEDQLKSLHDSINTNVSNLGNNTIKLGGDTGETDEQSLNKDGGIQFNIKGSELVKTTAEGTDITIDLSDKVKDELGKGVAANSGVASAVAMANLPQVSNIAGHRHNIAGAYGYYNGEHAFALGLSGLNETGNLVYKASGSLNTKGHVALGAGLGYQFDKLESRRKDMLTLQRNGNINLLDEKVYELDNEVKELKEKNKSLEDRVSELERLMKEFIKK